MVGMIGVAAGIQEQGDILNNLRKVSIERMQARTFRLDLTLSLLICGKLAEFQHAFKKSIPVRLHQRLSALHR